MDIDFLAVFEKIDRDYSGEISTANFLKGLNQETNDEKFISQCASELDPTASGKIRIEDYAHILNVTPRQEYMNIVNENKHNLSRTPPRAAAANDEYDEDLGDLNIITVDPDMHIDLRRFIVRLARDAQDQHTVEKLVAQAIKTELDDKCERVWQVIVGRFQYGSLVSHEPGYFFHFCVGRYAFLCWKTPEY